jgi:hypothetical protein
MIKDIDQIREMKIAELNRIISEFSEKIGHGTDDPEDFIKFHEMEHLWSELRQSSDKIYSDMICEMLANVDEKELIRKKKLNTDPKEST